MMSHVLEHLGASTDLYLGIIEELYRICGDGATVTIIVPNPRYDFFLHDPTHVRPIAVDGLAMFSHEANRKWIAMGGKHAARNLSGRSFAIQSVTPALDEPWRERLERKEISNAAQLHTPVAVTQFGSDRARNLGDLTHDARQHPNAVARR